MSNQEINLDKIGQPLKKYYKSAIVVILVLIVAFGSFFQVEAEEEGVVTRFGKQVRTVKPG